MRRCSARRCLCLDDRPHSSESSLACTTHAERRRRLASPECGEALCSLLARRAWGATGTPAPCTTSDYLQTHFVTKLNRPHSPPNDMVKLDLTALLALSPSATAYLVIPRRLQVGSVISDTARCHAHGCTVRRPVSAPHMSAPCLFVISLDNCITSSNPVLFICLAIKHSLHHPYTLLITTIRNSHFTIHAHPLHHTPDSASKQASKPNPHIPSPAHTCHPPHTFHWPPSLVAPKTRRYLSIYPRLCFLFGHGARSRLLCTCQPAPRR